MKKLNFLAIVASMFILAACGEQTRENQNYEAPESTQDSPSDVYNEGEMIEEEPVEDPAFDINENEEGINSGLGTEENDPNLDATEAEGMENTEEDTITVQ